MWSLVVSNKYFLCNKFRVAAIAATVALLASCASMGPQTPEKIVEKRATDYWKARMSAKYEEAYKFSTPGYRKVRTPEQYKLQFGAGAAVVDATVTKVECGAEKCDVQMRLGVKPAILMLKLDRVETYMNETWLLEDGQWWHYQDL
jgi:hypothetical protein